MIIFSAPPFGPTLVVVSLDRDNPGGFYRETDSGMEVPDEGFDAEEV